MQTSHLPLSLTEKCRPADGEYLETVSCRFDEDKENAVKQLAVVSSESCMLALQFPLGVQVAACVRVGNSLGAGDTMRAIVTSKVSLILAGEERRSLCPHARPVSGSHPARILQSRAPIHAAPFSFTADPFTCLGPFNFQGLC